MIETTLCYIEKEQSYLMLHRIRKKNDVNAGKWIGVGGKFEPGETEEACLLREVYEETGLTLTQYEKRGVIYFKAEGWEDEVMHLYTATQFTGELIEDCVEGVLKWVPFEEIEALSLWEGDRLFLKKLLQGEKDIRMTLSYNGDQLVSVKDTLEEF